MITFKKIRWKNFLSTGDQFSEIDFLMNATNLIVGTNGTGKSTALDALTFGLFNKPFRKINKGQLVNSTNEKGCLVEVEFNLNGREYLVRRGIKPNVFDIVVNDVAMHKEADDRAMQKILEEGILKLNYKSFTQIVILGSSAFVPFMQLSGTNRREVIEDLLDIRVFSAMNTLIREKIKIQKDEIKTLELSKENVKDKVEMQKNFIEELESRGKERIEEKNGKINLLEGEIQETSDETECLVKDVEMFTNDLEELSGAKPKLKKLNTLKGKMSNKVATLTKEHKFFTENTVCPTCSQNIEEEFRVNRITDVQTKATELQTGYRELEDAIQKEEEREHQFTKLSKEITKLNNGISKNHTLISGCLRQIRDLESEIQGLTDQHANRNTEQGKLAEFNENLQQVYKKLADKKEEVMYHDFAYSLLKDDGVKTKIIKKYLPLINQQVNRYLQMMDFYINFKLDGEFNETIESPIHERFSYASFSEGEKMRIDLALLFTWREVARVKNSINTNLLIMDEIFDSSLDTLGTDEFLKIIRFVIKDANVFVISHKTELHDKFDSVIKFEKVRGFSRISNS
jgi:DNA repair exonuclease SbcCD ATPase subunit